MTRHDFGLTEQLDRQALSRHTAETLVRRISQDIREHDKGFAPDGDVKGWLTEARGMLKFCSTVEEGFATARAMLLHSIRVRWDELPLQDFRVEYDNDFFRFAQSETGKDRATIENHLRAIQTFMVDGVAPSGALDVPLRDNENRVVFDDALHPKTQPAEWKPEIVPISKLVLIAGRARQGTMTRELWSMAADPGCSWEQLQVAMQLTGSGSSGSGGSDLRFNFFVSGPLLMASEDGCEAVLGELHWDEYYNQPDSFGHRAMSRLMAILGITLDEKRTEKEQIMQSVIRMGVVEPTGEDEQ